MIIAGIAVTAYLTIFFFGLAVDSDYSFAQSWMFFLAVVLGYGLTFFCLLTKKKIGHYIGLLTYATMSLLFLQFALKHIIATDVLFFGINFIGFLLLLIDKKNYFAAAKNAKNEKSAMGG